MVVFGWLIFLELVAETVYEGGINVEDAHTLFDRVEDLWIIFYVNRLYFLNRKNWV